MRRRASVRTYIAIISLASVGVTLAMQAVSPALPELQRVFDLKDSQVGWFVSAYVLPGVLLTVPMGILGDAIGRRLLFCLALTTYGIAAIVQGSTSSYLLLLTMRVLQGACFAAAMPLTITLIGEAFAGTQRVQALAGRNAVLTGSEVVLPISGALLAAISWRAPLLVQSITIPLALYSFAILEEHETTSGGKRKYARDIFSVLRAQHGMFAILLTGFSRYFFKFVMYAYLPLMLVNQRGASLTQAGIVISFTSLVAALAATRTPVAIRTIGPSSAVLASVLGLAASTGAFALVPDWKWALPIAAVYGIGDGLISVLQDTYAIHAARSHVRAGMVSVSQTARNLGKFVSPVAMSAIVAVSSLQIAFFIMTSVGVAMLPLLLPLRAVDAELRSSGFDPAAEARSRPVPTKPPTSRGR